MRDSPAAIRYVELDAMVDRLKSGSDGQHHHFPGERRMKIDWTQAPDGSWESTAVDEKLWEVVCPQCGDTDGPIEIQNEVSRALRGPYKHRHKAKSVSDDHFAAN